MRNYDSNLNLKNEIKFLRLETPNKMLTQVVNTFIIEPLEIVVEDICVVKRWFQRVFGWTVVVFIIAGITVVVRHPDYENERKQISEIFYAHK
jgi:hypothetical protein